MVRTAYLKRFEDRVLQHMRKMNDDLSQLKQEMFEELKVGIVSSNIEKTILEFVCVGRTLIRRKKEEKWFRLSN
jgi:aspartate/glutamate racemase